jgi:hypothetical protein
LNVLHQLLPPLGDETDQRAQDNSIVSRAAMNLHQRFQRKIIAKMPHEGGQVSLETINAWVEAWVDRDISKPGTP